MKLLIVLGLVAVAIAAAPPFAVNSRDVQVLRYRNINAGLGDYKYFYELSDGTKQEQRGKIRDKGTENEHIAVRGTFQWIGPNGIKYSTRYVADENGYQVVPEGGPGGPGAAPSELDPPTTSPPPISPAALAGLLGR